MLQSLLFKIKDHRRRQGRRYQLGHILLFAIFALLSGATSYRKVHPFIQAHYKTLDEASDLNRKRLPAYTTLRDIIQGMSPAEIEVRFRAYSAHLAGNEPQKRFVGLDGKVLRRSVCSSLSQVTFGMTHVCQSARYINDSICAALMPAQSLQEPETDQEIVGVTNWAGVSGWHRELEHADMSVDLSIVCVVLPLLTGQRAKAVHFGEPLPAKIMPA